MRMWIVALYRNTPRQVMTHDMSWGPKRPHKHKDPTSWFYAPKKRGIPELMFCRILMYLFLLYHIILYHTILYHTLLDHIMLYHIIL